MQHGCFPRFNPRPPPRLHGQSKVLATLRLLTPNRTLSTAPVSGSRSRRPNFPAAVRCSSAHSGRRTSHAHVQSRCGGVVLVESMAAPRRPAALSWRTGMGSVTAEGATALSAWLSYTLTPSTRCARYNNYRHTLNTSFL